MASAHDDDEFIDEPAPGEDETLLGARRDHRTTRRRARRRRVIVAAFAAVVVAATGTGVVWAATQQNEVVQMVEPTASETWAATPTPTPPPVEAAPTTEPPAPPVETVPAEPTPEGNLAVAGDIATATSPTVFVNKLTPLNPADYEPTDLVPLTSIGVPSLNDHSLREPAALAVQTMFADASAAGIALDMTSGYRAYDLQTELYNGYVASLGQEGADATSARPGFSEHQTGLAADISSPNAGCVLEQCFAETAEGQWLAANAWQYGFILRYPAGLTEITGYEFEPWHYRYVGTDVATAMHEQGTATYEEFLGQPPAPDYAN